MEAALGQLLIVLIMWQLTFYINLYKMMLGSTSFDAVLQNKNGSLWKKKLRRRQNVRKV